MQTASKVCSLAIPQIAIDRLSKLGIPISNIKIGDALEEKNYSFSDTSIAEAVKEAPIKSKTITETEPPKNLELENF